jgi:hypothetical protein
VGQGAHTIPRRVQGVARAWGWSGRPMAPLPQLFGSSGALRENNDFGFCPVQFREYLLCNFSETQKQQKIGTGTMASC